MKTRSKIQIVACGPGLDSINAKHGRSCDWLESIIESDSLDISIIEAYKGEKPLLSDDAVWFIMGSRYSAYSDLDWIKSLEKQLQIGIQNKIPMLGICFGHQVLCQALGAKVVKNRNGWEIGSAKMGLTEKGLESSLFDGFEDSFCAYESHQDVVVDLPSNIDILAYNNYGIQSFSFSDHIYGVQFHPEFNFEVMKAYYDIRVNSLENKDDYYVEDKNDGIDVINNFIKFNLKGK